MKILITGFDAFGKDQTNPSYEAIKKLPSTINGVEIIKKQLPTKYLEASTIIKDLLDKDSFDYVFLCGQAAGRKEISLEKIALNIMDARIEDNAGYQPKDVVIKEEGEIAYQSDIDLIGMEVYLNKENIPAKISYHAGAFVCNSTYYNLLHTIKFKNLKTSGLFIHVPILEEQVKNYDTKYPTMSLEEITKALHTIISFISL